MKTLPAVKKERPTLRAARAGAAAWALNRRTALQGKEKTPI